MIRVALFQMQVVKLIMFLSNLLLGQNTVGTKWYKISFYCVNSQYQLLQIALVLLLRTAMLWSVLTAKRGRIAVFTIRFGVRKQIMITIHFTIEY